MPDSPIAFDKAEYVKPAAMSCAVCKQEIGSEYYDVNGHPICGSCLQRLEQGSGGDWTKALLLGIGAAVVGAILWFVVEKYLNLRIGIVAIAIGWAVAKGIRKGAGRDSSIAFPIVSVLLTYLSIAGASYLEIATYLGEQGRTAAVSDLVPLAIKLPVTGSSPIGLLIIAFGLYEAWRLARAPKLRINGPFPVARGAVG